MAPRSPSPSPPPSCVDLYWLPLGAGEASPLVRWSGRAYEALAAARGRRPRQRLFHSALKVRRDGVRSVIEMGPVWGAVQVPEGGRAPGWSAGLVVAARDATPGRPALSPGR